LREDLLSSPRLAENLDIRHQCLWAKSDTVQHSGAMFTTSILRMASNPVIAELSGQLSMSQSICRRRGYNFGGVPLWQLVYDAIIFSRSAVSLFTLATSANSASGKPKAFRSERPLPQILSLVADTRSAKVPSFESRDPRLPVPTACP
jgi:hypothetical protein